MADRSKIQWCDATWNPCTGCTRISEACDNCYALRMLGRNLPSHSGPEPTFHPDRLDVPLHWRKPRRVFVCSMSDLFHEAFTSHDLDRVFETMAKTPQHTFMLLTKRPERTKEYMKWGYPTKSALSGQEWPLPNVWLGVTVENQQRADERIPVLLDTPAAVRFVSCEPLLSAIDLSRYLRGGMDRDGQRSCIHDGTGVRDVLNRHEWTHLASSQDVGRESCGDAISQSAGRDHEGGDSSVARPPACAVLDPGRAHVGVRASGGLDGREPSGDSEWSGDQPQGWRPGEQRPGESGAGDQAGEHTARWPGSQATGEEGSARRGECLSEGHRGRRETHSRTVGAADDDAARDRGVVRNQAGHGELHHPPQELGSREVALNWLIVGGETGPGSRPMQPEWALDVYRQCKAAGVPFFFKQWGRVDARGLGDEYEAMERTRELPEVPA